MIIIATNWKPNGALAAYKALANRMPVRRHQDRGLNMEDTKLTQPAKLSLLMGVVALAPGMGACLRIRDQGSRQHWIAGHPDRASHLSRSIWNRPKPNLSPARVV